MDFYTFVLRKSDPYWVALCLENGLVGQGVSSDEAVGKLKDAVVSFQDILKVEKDVYNEPISIKDLHEFRTIEGIAPQATSYELWAVYA